MKHKAEPSPVELKCGVRWPRVSYIIVNISGLRESGSKIEAKWQIAVMSGAKKVRRGKARYNTWAEKEREVGTGRNSDCFKGDGHVG